MSDSPIFEPRTGKPDTAEPDTANPYLSKNELSKNDSTKKSKESEETSPIGDAGSFEEIEAEWIPVKGTKAEQLKRIRTPQHIPSEREFDRFISDECLDHIGMGKGGDLYARLTDQKWHHWSHKRVWKPINDWRAYVRALDAKMDDATKGF